MEEVFYGPWDVRVLSKDAWFSEQIVVTGSDASDGVYAALPGGGPGPVSGARWTLHAEWNDNAGSGWHRSALRRTGAYTLADGLTVTIGIDDNADAVRDHDYNDVVVIARSLDPGHTPLHPLAAPLDFTVPEKVWWEYWKASGRDPKNPYRGYPPIDDPKDPLEPEQKEPEQQQPEQKEPEQKEPEQQEPEQKEPEQQEPEQKQPEQKKPKQ